MRNFSFDRDAIEEIEYEMTDDYQNNKIFLENRERFLHYLFNG